MRYFRIRKHDEFQHYKNRNPPWIKLHTCILGSVNFLGLSDASKWHAIACALLASRYQNHIPADAQFLKEESHSKMKMDLEALFDAKFIVWCKCDECASEVLADCKQVARPEREREGEREESREEQDMSRTGAPSADVTLVWKEYTEAHERFYLARNGLKPAAVPSLTPTRKKLIRAAIKIHGVRRSRAAAQGIFLSEFHTGKNDNGKLYLKPEHVWRMPSTAGKGPDNVENFSDLYSEWESSHAGQ